MKSQSLVTLSVGPESRKPPVYAASVSENVREILDAAKNKEQRAEKEHTLDAAQAVALAEEALGLLRTIPNEAVSIEQVLLESQVYFTRGSAQERLSDYDGAFQSGEQALLRAEQAHHDGKEKAAFGTSSVAAAVACMKAYNLLGNVCDRRGDHAAALEYRQADYDLALRLGNMDHRAHALMRLGRSYYRIGDYPTALNFFLQARSLFETLTDSAGLGSAWNDIGNVYYSESDYAAALNAYQSGLEQFQNAADPYWQAGLLSNIAGIHLQQNRHAEARACLEQSLHLREAVGDRHGQGYSLTSLVEVLRYEGKSDLALMYGRQALALFEQIGDQMGQAVLYIQLAVLESDAGNDSKAEFYLTESLIYTEAQGLRDLSYQIHRELSRLNEKTGDPVRALYHYKKFHTVKEELLNETSSTRLRNLEVRYRVAQAQREASLLRQHNEALSTSNARQAELLEQFQQQAIVLETLSRTDALTGLLNRRSLGAEFREAHEHASKHGEPLSVALMDLDHFKRINDRFSHQTGDTVLQIVARLLTHHCRAADIVARYGGEEMVMVMPGLTLAEAIRLCEQLRERIAEYPWKDLHPDLQVSLSFGLCGTDTAAFSNPEQMLAQADVRLYEAKAMGRNLVRA